MNFGFTNDREIFDGAVKFREGAMSDGWKFKDDQQDMSYARLIKDGFVMHVCARKDVGKWQYQAMVSVWGPDGLAIHPDNEYDWDQIQSCVRTCLECGATNVETFRVGFAGRVCEKCLPEQRRKIETPGWCD